MVDILYIAEGNSETWQSWSGCSRGVVTALRAAGASVRTADVLPGRFGRYASMALAWAPERSRWVARYHTGSLGFALRTRRAAVAVRRGPNDVAIQAGATFDLPADGTGGRRYVYCDANALFAVRGGPYSSVAALNERELGIVLARERAIYQSAHGIFVFSECLRRSFVNDFGLAPDKVHVVYAGSNLRRAPDDGVLRRPAPSVPTVLFVGKAFERKGGHDLLAAWAHVRKAIPEARLRIVGPALPNLDIPGTEVIGYVDPSSTGPGSLSALYAEADLFCMPSRYEPFGVVFIEAMLHGVPCVGSDAWAMPEIIDQEETGWLVPAADPAALAETLIHALSDRDRLRAMGRTGRQRSLARFTWDRVGRRMLEVLTSPDTARSA